MSTTAAQPELSVSEAELRELLATSCRILYHLGLCDYLGHPSARVPGTDRVIIKPKHSARVRRLDSITADMMVVVDLDGNHLEGDEIPPAERFIHTEIYRARPDVLSVVHTHQPMATLVERGVPTFPCAELIVNQELGRGTAEALGDHSLCHLQGHGIVSVATTVQDATLGAIHLERLAEANFQAAQVGRKPWVIPPDQIAALRRELASPAGRWAYYTELVS
jgi:L-ribulose-5-phosphate 4-epimerase